MQTTDGNRLDGCAFGDPSPQDYRLEFGNRTLPKHVDLRQHCTAVENQGTIGSCTANACVGALEYAYTKRDGTAPDLSRMFVYFNTRRLKGTINQDTGAAINEAMAAVMAFGACESGFWPYDPGLFSQEPSQQAYMNGKLHEAIQYARVPGPGGAMHALADGYPVVFGTFLPSRLYDVAAQTGVMPASEPAERRGRPSGGHCMLIVGYDSDRQVFIVRNSWGTGWGTGGYCEIPFAEMAYFSPPETFWIMTELEPSANFSVVKPGAGAMTADAPEPRLGVTAADLRAEIGGDLRRELGQARDEAKSTAAALRASMSGETAGAGTCQLCSGSGACYFCSGGTDTVLGTPCMTCSGTGKCETCGGSGERG